jgi:hypothetical protein
MAQVQASGQIDILDLVTVFGGSAPHRLQEYYRGGSLVPASRFIPASTSYGPYGGEVYSAFNPVSYVQFVGGTTGWAFYFNGTYLGNSPGSTSFFTGTVQYTQGTNRDGDLSAIKGRSYTTTPASTVNINTGVPASGRIRLQDFYGAEKP